MKAYNRRRFLRILSGAGFLPLVQETLFSYAKFTHYVKISTQLDAASFVAARLEFPQGFVIETGNSSETPVDFSRYLSGDLNLNGVRGEPFELQAVVNDIMDYSQENLPGYPKLSETDRILLDIDGDGKLTVFDAVKGTSSTGLNLI